MATNGDSISTNSLVQSISSLGIIGNTILLWIIFYSKKLRDPSYIFVTNIAISDLTTSIQVLIIFSTSNTPFLDVSGNVICKIVYSILFASYSASMSSLTLISIYRLSIVSNPHQFKQTSYIYKHSTKLAILIWISSILFAIPLHPVIRYSNITRSCDISYPYGNIYNVIYFSSSLMINFVVPRVVMIICYIRIASKLNSRIFSVRNHINVKLATLIRSKELLKIYGIITAIYMILSWPFMMILLILSIVQETQVSLIDENIGLAWAVGIAFIASNITYVINPIMFMAFDKNIKSDIKKIANRARSIYI